MSWENIYRDMLSQKGLKNTAVRVVVLKILDDSEIPMTVEEIFVSVRSLLSSVNLSTVYRTMETLLKNGLVEKTALLDENKARYEFRRVEAQTPPCLYRL